MYFVCIINRPSLHKHEFKVLNSGNVFVGGLFKSLSRHTSKVVFKVQCVKLDSDLHIFCWYIKYTAQYSAFK